MKINEQYKYPQADLSCPGCGQMYGHHNTKVCEDCEECSVCCKNRKCVKSENHKFISAREMIRRIIKG